MSFASNAGMESPKEAFRLWAAKPRLAGESSASWIQRLCGDHQYSIKVLGQLLDYRPTRGDWDRGLHGKPWERLLRLVTVLDRRDWHGEMGLLRVMHERGKRICHLRMVGVKPAYRWCPTCFAEDKTPYLRWYWRLDSIRECWVHQIPLCEWCDVCGEAFLVHRARLVGKSASMLSECPTCGASLTSPMANGGSYDRLLQRKLKTLFDPWWSVAGTCRVDSSLAIMYHFSVLDRHQLATARVEANVVRRDELLKQEKFWVLGANCFREEATLHVDKDVAFRAPWQWNLDPGRRLAVAEALRSIRIERRTNKSELGAPS
jgi:hypothetical protein